MDRLKSNQHHLFAFDIILVFHYFRFFAYVQQQVISELIVILFADLNLSSQKKTGLIALAYSIKSSAKADVKFHDKARLYARRALLWNLVSVLLVVLSFVAVIELILLKLKIKTIFFCFSAFAFSLLF